MSLLYHDSLCQSLQIRIYCGRIMSKFIIPDFQNIEENAAFWTVVLLVESAYIASLSKLESFVFLSHLYLINDGIYGEIFKLNNNGSHVM